MKIYTTIKALKVKKKQPRQKQAALTNVAVIIQSIQEKKGDNIVSIDLRNIPDAITDFFIICDADSTTQVKAIADNVDKKTREVLGEKPWHTEGFGNLQWVLLDYVDTVVHVFLKPMRNFYQLEELWSDAVIEEHND